MERHLVDGIRYDTVVTQSVARQIAESLRTAIIEGHLRVDERLPTEEELAERFSVSRPTIREALKRLAAQNLIRSQRGPSGGTFVTRPTRSDLQESLTSAATMLVTVGDFGLEEIAEARHSLEVLCCRFAVSRRCQEHLDIMEEEIRRQQSGISDTEFCASDVRFHRALVDASGNAVLQFVMYAVIEALQPLANMVAFRFRERDRIIDQHERLHRAVLERNETAAVQVLDEQMRYLAEQYAKARQWQMERDKARKEG